MQYEKAINECERAVALDPNSADAFVWLGTIYCYADRAKEGTILIEKAVRLNPFAHTWYFTRLGAAYRLTGRYEEAIAAFDKALRLSPNNIIAHINLTIIYSQLGRDDKAHFHAAEVIRISPNFSLSRFAKKLPFKNQAENESIISSLSKAGLK